MRLARTLVILTAAWLAIAPATPAQPTTGRQRATPVPAGVKVVRDLEFAELDRLGNTLALDLYLPDSPAGNAAKPDAPAQALPVIVWIHGGGWSSGSRANCPAAVFAAQGFAVASISHRFSQQAIFPAQIHDCKAAIRWLRANAVEYGLDADRIGVWGASSGGHLAALLGTTGGVEEMEGRMGGNLAHSSQVQAVCVWFGPTDFLQMNAQAPPDSRIDHNAPTSPESRLIGGPIQQNRELARAANPITYITGKEPPFLIMHGDRDNMVPLGQSKLLYEALKAADVNATLHILEGAGHGTRAFADPEAEHMVLTFVNKHLRGVDTPPLEPKPAPGTRRPATPR
jgi:acetyl esterase/lipase